MKEEDEGGRNGRRKAGVKEEREESRSEGGQKWTKMSERKEGEA